MELEESTYLTSGSITKLQSSTETGSGVWTVVCESRMFSVAKSCPTLWDTMDCSPPGSSAMEFSRQEHWNGLPFPTPGNLPNPGIEPTSPASPALAGAFFTTEPSGKPQNQDRAVIFLCKVHGHLLLFSHQLVSDSLRPCGP